MTYYARVVFETNASAAQRHDDVSEARRWIDDERQASPERFRFAEIIEGTAASETVATCDLTGWHPR